MKSKSKKSKLLSILYILITFAFIVAVNRLAGLHKITLILLIVSLVGIGVFITLKILNRTKYISIIVYLIIPLIVFLYIISRRFTYINGSTSFYIASLIITLVYMVLNITFGFEKETKFISRFLLTLLTAVFIYIGVLGIIKDANYAFDNGEPTPYTIVITDKDYVRRRKQADKYEFEFYIGEECYWIEVTSSVYEKYEIGDKYTVKKYEGCFNREFFIA